jgi:hypothetical protein
MSRIHHDPRVSFGRYGSGPATEALNGLRQKLPKATWGRIAYSIARLLKLQASHGVPEKEYKRLLDDR